jgi:hypothetical protein
VFRQIYPFKDKRQKIKDIRQKTKDPRPKTQDPRPKTCKTCKTARLQDCKTAGQFIKICHLNRKETG